MAGAGALLKRQFNDEFAFKLEDGAVVIRSMEGNPVILIEEGKTRPAKFTEADIKTLCDQSEYKSLYDHLVCGSRASGGGALGPGRAVPTQPDKPAPKPAPVHFGLA